MRLVCNSNKCAIIEREFKLCFWGIDTQPQTKFDQVQSLISL